MAGITLRPNVHADAFAIAYVDVIMREMLRGALQAREIPVRIPRRPKKFAAHVVIYTDHGVPVAVEMLHGFRADQSAATRDENFHRTPAAAFSSLP